MRQVFRKGDFTNRIFKTRPAHLFPTPSCRDGMFVENGMKQEVVSCRDTTFRSDKMTFNNLMNRLKNILFIKFQFEFFQELNILLFKIYSCMVFFLIGNIFIDLIDLTPSI